MINKLSGFLICILLSVQICNGQHILIDTSSNISRNPANDLFASWSPDGKNIIYQSNRNGNWDIFLYNFESDKTIQLTNSVKNEQHPEWHPFEENIIFDADYDTLKYLNKINLLSGEIEPLFDRQVVCKQASVSKDGRMVYFLGYDNQHGNWALNSYHFIYDNLNQITNSKGNGTFLSLAQDGKSVLYGYESPTYPFHRLKTFNWYGKEILKFEDFNIFYATWHPDGLKIYFISDKDNLDGELYSIWRDGTHLMPLTNDNFRINDLSISPDGNSMACSVLLEGNYEIIIIQLESF
jgi:TolB protein